MKPRLDRLSGLKPGVSTPSYGRNRPSGIVHLGVGAFHKVHQAVHTDDALERSGGDWMITGVSLRSADVAAALNPQRGLYTVLTRGPEGVSARVIGSIAEVLVAPDDQAGVLLALASPATRIVSLTITEKGYGLDPKTGGLDRNHPAVAADLADPNNTQSALGFIVAALHVRRMLGHPPFTVLCCDNLPCNGKVLRRLVLDFAVARDPGMVRFVENEVSFPSTMVDRITPASTDTTFADALALTGREDLAAIETEPFSQWIIEDDFGGDRPDWQAGGALFVNDVAPYEKMKLRMLNGSHSMLAYAGFIAGHKHVRDVMGDADLARYGQDLRDRFANPAIAHENWQIAMDGTQKLFQRLIEPATSAMARGLPLDAYAFAVAAWMRFAVGLTEKGEAYALRDPREGEIGTALAGAGHEARVIVERLLSLPGLFPEELGGSAQWREALVRRLGIMLADGMRAAIAREADTCRG